MKTLLYLFAVVFLYAAPLYAQNPPESQAIPELQEWWRAPANEKGLGRYGVSHIPNFYHGKDAMGVSINNGQMETWLNRFPGDRENVFTWKGGGPVLQADFNGDGITDYLGGAIVYRGVKNGEPPDSIPVRTLTISPSMIADVNHDGYADIIDWYDGGGLSYGGSIGRVAYGAADFNDMKVVSFHCATSMDSTMEMERMYMGTDGDMRILMFAYDLVGDPRRDFNGYFLFRAKWKTGDTLPTYEKLAEVIRYYDTDIPLWRSGAVYQSKHHSNIYFIVREFLGATANQNVIYFDLSKDKFEQKLKFNVTGMSFIPHVLNRSVDGDIYEDWYINSKSGEAIIFSGGNTLGSTPRFKITNKDIGIDLAAISDVNSDSIADIVVFGNYFDEPSFFIVKGQQSPNSVISESIPTGHCSLDVLTPHPIKFHTDNTLGVTVNQEGQYSITLNNAVGQFIGVLYNGEMSLGEHQIPLFFPTKGISSGEYVLRLEHAGKVEAEKRIVIFQ